MLVEIGLTREMAKGEKSVLVHTMVPVDDDEYEYVIQTGCFPDTRNGRCCKRIFLFFSYCIFGLFFFAFLYLLYRFMQSFNVMVDQGNHETKLS